MVVKKVAKEKCKIRKAVIGDKNEILSLIDGWDRKFARRYYDDYFSKTSAFLKKDRVFVLVSEGRVRGVVGYFVDRYESKNHWLGWFYVDEKFRRRGYGQKLLNHIFGELKKKRIKKLFVDTSSHKRYEPALEMYKKNGFREEARIKDYYEDGEDQIMLSKKLAQHGLENLTVEGE